jgi:hypothetical protein
MIFQWLPISSYFGIKHKRSLLLLGGAYALLVCGSPLYIDSMSGHDAERISASISLLLISGLLFLVGVSYLRLTPLKTVYWSEEALLFFIISVGILMRISWWGLPPFSSEDVWRYLWDGRLQWLGAATYLYAPSDELLTPFLEHAPELKAMRVLIGHPELTTIYPPGAQLIFKGVTWGGASLLKIRVATLGADLILMGALYVWLKRLERSPLWLGVYALCPLAAFEIALGCHLDIFGVAMMMWGLYWVQINRFNLGVLTLTFGAWIKLIPGLILSVLVIKHFRRLSTQERLQIILIILGVSIVCLAPFWEEYLHPSSSPNGAWSYFMRWRFNDGLFTLCLTAMESVIKFFDFREVSTEMIRTLMGGDADLNHQDFSLFYTKICIGCGLVIYWWYTLKGQFLLGQNKYREEDLYRVVFLILVSLLLVSPVVYSWYLLWILPFAPLFLSYHHAEAGDRSRSQFIGLWILFWITIVPITYLARQKLLFEGIWHIDRIWILCEYTLLWLTLGLIKRYTPPHSHT